MIYWFTLSFFSLCLIGCILYMLKRKIKDKDLDKETLALNISLTCIPLFITALLILDIPSALSGGEKVYTSELPTLQKYGHYMSFNITDNEELKLLHGCNWNKYEKYGNYCISYTKHTKYVLDIKKLD